jgi:hypothetical protein
VTWSCARGAHWAALLLVGCAPRVNTAAPLRSPSHDYPPPPRTTADGEILGADRKPITDAIRNTLPPPPEREDEGAPVKSP